jgi:hypothetical protein
MKREQKVREALHLGEQYGCVPEGEDSWRGDTSSEHSLRDSPVIFHTPNQIARGRPPLAGRRRDVESWRVDEICESSKLVRLKKIASHVM